PGHALAAALQGLDELLAVAAQAQCDPRVSQVPVGGVVILVVQLDALPAAAVAPGQHRVVAQGRQGGAAGAQFDFGFFVHERSLAKVACIVRAGRSPGAAGAKLFQSDDTNWPAVRSAFYNPAYFKQGPPYANQPLRQPVRAF